MRFGFDSAQCPTPWQSRAMKAQGHSFTGVYIGGPTAASWGFTADSVRQLNSFFPDSLQPIYAGVGTDGPFTEERGAKDGYDALAKLRNLGIAVDGPLTNDVEAELYDYAGASLYPYHVGWTNTIRDAGGVCILYGNERTIDALGGLYDCYYLADWLWTVQQWNEQGMPQDGIVTSAGPNGCQLHQFAYGGRTLGLRYDLVAADDSWTFAKLAPT